MKDEVCLTICDCCLFKNEKTIREGNVRKDDSNFILALVLITYYFLVIIFFF